MEIGGEDWKGGWSLSEVSKLNGGIFIGYMQCYSLTEGNEKYRGEQVLKGKNDGHFFGHFEGINIVTWSTVKIWTWNILSILSHLTHAICFPSTSEHYKIFVEWLLGMKYFSESMRVYRAQQK